MSPMTGNPPPAGGTFHLAALGTTPPGSQQQGGVAIPQGMQDQLADALRQYQQPSAQPSAYSGTTTTTAAAAAPIGVPGGGGRIGSDGSGSAFSSALAAGLYGNSSQAAAGSAAGVVSPSRSPLQGALLGGGGGATTANGPVLAASGLAAAGVDAAAAAAAAALQLELLPERRITLHFSVPYHTLWGQSLVLCGSGALLGNMQVSKGRQMSCHHDKDTLVWEVTAVLPWKPCYTYKYAVVRQHNDDSGPGGSGGSGHCTVEKEDAAGERTVWLPEGVEGGDLVEVCDTWVDPSHPAVLMACAAFAQVLFAARPVVHMPDGLPASERRPVVAGETVIRLQVADAQLSAGQTLLVTGGIPQLGNWQPDQMMQLVETGTPHWEAEIRVPYTSFSFTYKYAIRTQDGLLLEVGEPRLATLPPSTTAVGAPSVMVRHDGYFRRDRYWRGAGVAVPVFSLRTARSCGVGEFLDLLPLIDLADRCGLRLIQVLPVNDTCVYGTWWDSYPYSTLSVHAMHPQYIALRALLDPDMLVSEEGDVDPGARGAASTAAGASATQQRQGAPTTPAQPAVPRELPAELAEELRLSTIALAGPEVDYTATMAFKTAFIRKVYERYGHATTASLAYRCWLERNASWLRPYAAFCLLRDIFQTSEHWRWGCLSGAGAAAAAAGCAPGSAAGSAEPGSGSGSASSSAGPASVEETVARLTSPGGEWWSRVELIYYTQYHLHRQLKKAADYARCCGVVLKGDLPIGVDKRSVDTWAAPHLFRMDKSTGSPPDAFSATGQNWGFPTYNWQAMEAEGFAWWRSRLGHLSQYFSALRVDHILGFFRIWEIPGDCTTGTLGYFRPSVPLTRSELEQRGLWDINRLTQPYITTPLLKELFGVSKYEEVAARFMLEDGNGRYRLRPAFSSEAAIAAIPVRPGSPEWLVAEVEAMRKGLLTLRQNVCLIQDPEDPDTFHPRFGLMSTSSYGGLAAPLRAALRHMHDDYYYRRQEDTWRASALSKLPALQAASGMLICGEDLGFVPACVPPVMKELGLIGLRIQRMSTEPGGEFNNPGSYPYLTVASPSCHDVTPLRAWYESDPEAAERFYYSQLGGCGPPPPSCSPDVARAVVQQHINCPSMLAIFPLQDLLALSPVYSRRPAMEELINDPTVSKHYWRYRVHVPVETLLRDDEWCATIAEMLVLGERT